MCLPDSLECTRQVIAGVLVAVVDVDAGNQIVARSRDTGDQLPGSRLQCGYGRLDLRQLTGLAVEFRLSELPCAVVRRLDQRCDAPGTGVKECRRLLQPRGKPPVFFYPLPKIPVGHV